MIVRKSVEQRQKEMAIMGCFGIPFVLWLGLAVGPLLRRGFSYAFYNMDKIKFFPINVSAWNWKYAFIFLLIYILAIGVYISSIQDIDTQTPDGSLSWGSVKRLYRKYADKKYYPVIIDDDTSLLKLPAESSVKKMEEDEKKKKGFALIAQKSIELHKADSKLQKKNDAEKKRLYNNMNKIFTQGTVMSFNGYKTRKNTNTTVIGGSGSGKTRFFVKPNLLQGNTSFIILDPKGELLRDCGWAMLQMGYKIKVLNLINMQESDCYNPFCYLENDNDIQHLVENLFKATGGNGDHSSQDPFWDNAAKALLTALVSYCHYFLPEEEQNFATVGELLRMGQIKNEDAGYKSDLDLIFDEIREEIPDKDPRWICLKFYDDYHSGAAKTLQSIQITLAARLNKFNIVDLQKLTSTDMLDLDMIGQEKTALFAIIPIANEDYNFLVSILYTQLFQRLFDVADSKYNGTLPVHVQFVLDEFANVALPDNFPKIVSVVRSYGISVSIILQNLAQLKSLFEKDWEGLLGNCDEILYLGGQEHETHKYLSEVLGKKTIHTKNHSRSRGQNGNFTDQDNTKGRELMMPEEVRLMNEEGDNALLIIKDERPVLDRKYDLLTHPNIRLGADGGAPKYFHNHLEVPEELCMSYGELNDILDTLPYDEEDEYELQVYTSQELSDLFINPEDEQLTMTESTVKENIN